MESFDLAARLGAQILEMDVHLSRDGEVVVIHDATLERTTNGTGAVRDHTWAELEALDAGYHHVSASGDLRFRDRGVRLSRLHDVLGTFPKHGFNIEVKQREPSMVDAVLDLLQRDGRDDILLAAGDDDIMRQLEAAEPDCALGLSFEQTKAVVIGAYLGGVPDGFRGRALQIPLRDVRLAFGLVPLTTKRVVRAAQAAGIEVHLWTINDTGVAKRWLDAGVDGIMTDDPGALHAVFEPYR